MTKLRVGILFGGRSAEHEISIQSAKSVIQAIDLDTYEVIPIGIDSRGGWHCLTRDQFLAEFAKDNLKNFNGEDQGRQISTMEFFENNLDVVFPLLHGPYGEDGSVQGFLKTLNIPFIGSCVLGSSISMDKVIMKRLFREAGLPIPNFLWMQKKNKLSFDAVVRTLGIPFFIKPANLGSSIGIHKVSTSLEFENALSDAFSFDQKIILEECIFGREIECSVLGNEFPEVSLPGEIIPRHEFYNYEAKYLDQRGAEFAIPAVLPNDIVQEIKKTAIRAFEAACCSGMARVDFFLTSENKLYVNEINTIPGFTRISLYPKLWEVSGISYPHLIDKLITLALESHHSRQTLKRSYHCEPAAF
ncbi:MAG: D-alanine--D-alanine ligase [Simkaniaceae bacterium]